MQSLRSSTPAKLAGFAVALALLFGVGIAAGDLAGPAPLADPVGHGSASSGHDDDAAASAGHEQAADPVRGLASAANGMRIVIDTPDLRRGRTQRLAFHIVDDRGATVRDFDVAHEKRMHLILARRDLTGFQHLHPRQLADGNWTTTARIDDPGSYRLFADFTRNGRAETLAGDVSVDGDADLRALPAASATARTAGGYEVRLDAGGARRATEAQLRFTITKDGAPVQTEPYLGAGGHLVALREGDLAFLHVHPTEDVTFAATFPTSGRYRLFLQFKHAGQVHTAAFTRVVA